MSLDSPITPEEEEIVAMVRTLQAKQVELAAAEQARVAAKAKVIAERARTENLRRNFIDEMRKRGVSDPDELLRRID